MTKIKKVIEPRFTLPGDDSFRVQWIAYSQGLDVISSMFFQGLPPGAPLPDGYLSTFPSEQAKIEDMARQVSELMLTVDADEQPVTNSPEVFKTLFSEAYIQGYYFSLYAVPHGLIPIQYALAPERRYELAYAFAYKVITGENAPDSDTVMDQALEKLQVIYKQYQSLN